MNANLEEDTSNLVLISMIYSTNVNLEELIWIDTLNDN